MDICLDIDVTSAQAEWLHRYPLSLRSLARAADRRRLRGPVQVNGPSDRYRFTTECCWRPSRPFSPPGTVRPIRSVTRTGDDLLPLRGVRAALGVQRGNGLFYVARERVDVLAAHRLLHQSAHD